MSEHELVYVREAVYALMLVWWIAFAIAMFTFKKPQPTGDGAQPAKESKRARVSIVGIALQGFAYGIVWAVRRPILSPFVPVSPYVELIINVGTIVIAACSVWISVAAIRTLGKQWSLTARLIEGHELVTAGPYQIVRHPIYTGMLGMLLATGLAWAHWIGLIAGIIVFAIGTGIRVRSEERLLRAQFGAGYDAYARRVWAVVPLPPTRG